MESVNGITYLISKIYRLWSSFATQKLNASIGFQDMAFEAKFSMVFATGIDVLRSYNTMDRSVAVDAKIEVSTGLKETEVIVSVEVGHLSTSGADEFRSRSNISITPEAAAKELFDL